MASGRKAYKVFVDRRHSPTDLFNNGVKIGHVENEHELEFKLDTPTGIASPTYTAWFMAWDDLQEDAILGADFNESKGFTNYHTRLVDDHISFMAGVRPVMTGRLPVVKSVKQSSQS